MKKTITFSALCLALLLPAGLSACKTQPAEPDASSSSAAASLTGEDTWEDPTQTTASPASQIAGGTNKPEKPIKDSVSVSVIAPEPDEVSIGSGAADTGNTNSNTNTSATGSVTSTENPSSQSEWIEGDF